MRSLKPSILVINSCGKKKSVQHDDQPTCKDLETKDQRESAKEKFSSLLREAGELYIGGQALAIKKAVKILSSKAEVDYYIISAGFGLVNENELLPPYECTFSGLSKKAIKERAEKLAIPESVRKLSKKTYDLVYLSLGEDYLVTLGDLKDLANLGKEIIFFGKAKDLPSNFHSFSTYDFVGKRTSKPIFKKPIGATILAKGTIFLNFAIEYTPGLSFKEWWNEKLVLVEKYLTTEKKDTTSKSEKSSLSKSIHGIRYDRKTDYLLDKSLVSIISSFVKREFSEEELRVLSEATVSLTSIDIKRAEEINKYTSKFSSKLAVYEKIVEQYNNLMEIIKTNTEGEITEEMELLVENEYANQVRIQQEKIKITKNVLNETKFVVIKKIVQLSRKNRKL
ncbi:MAG: DUF6884 domain-containing protein [Candidatus Heimdallarchaeaceae archaeon]